MDVNYWRCLNDTMWSQVRPVQIMTWRLLTKLNSEPWAQDLLDMLYLEDDTLALAKNGTFDDDAPTVKHKDSNGALLKAGDSVTLIKDLNVKGVSFTAKRGTAVRNISLVEDNSEQVEGRINGTQIIIHVCDENKKMNKDFKCDKNLLITNMKYFEKYLSDSKSLDDIDISVHCDINIFDWLMRYIHRKEPQIEIKNSVSILISSDFLQMAELVEEALTFVGRNLEEII